MIWTAIYIIAVWLALSIPIGLLTAHLMRPDADRQPADDPASECGDGEKVRGFDQFHNGGNAR